MSPNRGLPEEEIRRNKKGKKSDKKYKGPFPMACQLQPFHGHAASGEVERPFPSKFPRPVDDLFYPPSSEGCIVFKVQPRVEDCERLQATKVKPHPVAGYQEALGRYQ